MELNELLSHLPFVEGHRSVTNGVEHNTPYHTFPYQGVNVLGLRENARRLQLLRSAVDEHVLVKESILDIGCNLGTIGAAFTNIFPTVVGVDEDHAILALAERVYPLVHFQRLALNQERLLQRFNHGEFQVTLCLSMLEYVNDKAAFVSDLHQITRRLCIVEGHSEDFARGRDVEYEAILRTMPWTVTRLSETTDPGMNAPKESRGRPVWVCVKS